LALRAAPVQVNYLGYPGTTGAPYLDYILADATVIPEDHDAFYAERVVRLPGTYQINDNGRAMSLRTPARAECGLPQNGFVFCCFNNPQKITPEIFDIWMRLLQATEGSVLWLITGIAKAAANLRLEAEKRGVAPDRLIFAPKASVADHLARHRLADLCLDTLPYNAHTTASDALWAGLPVLTCLGETFAGRVAASLLRAIGLDALITHSLAEYETLALRLARDQASLATLKDTLKRNRDTYPLFDTQSATRYIEAAYLTMAEIARRHGKPRGFEVG
jgi:predicted O-linked N-acetylglucosamine transferase (SPINDLY family)